MAIHRGVEFGYFPPSGERGYERLDAKTFRHDLQGALDFASQYFSSFWLADHVMRGSFRMECWTELVWMAARYPGQKIGTMVMANSFRHPPLLARMAATLQYLSNGRLILGYGAGWIEEEYRAYGYDFPTTPVRIAQMVEGIEVMRALWTQSPANYRGKYYRVENATCEPRPDPAPPVLIGGDGEKYLLRAVAEHADIWLPFSRRIDVLRQKMDVLKQHCQAVGRDYESIPKAYMLVAYLSSSQAEAERRAGRLIEREKNPVFAGDPAAMRDRLEELIDLGFSQISFIFPNFPEIDDVKLFVDKVLPAFR